MTDAGSPGGNPENRLLRVVAEHWDEIAALADPEQRERLAGLISSSTGSDPAEARAALADELLDLLPPDHPAIRALTPATMYQAAPEVPFPGADWPVSQQVPPAARSKGTADTLPVTIYLSEASINVEVENAVELLLAAAGLHAVERDAPVLGSWFRRMLAGLQEVARSPAGHEAALMTAHGIESRLLLAQDAEVTAKMMQNLAPVLGALQPAKDAVIRVGALLIVKVDWTVNVFQLTAAQQVRLDHHPHLASSPSEIVAALRLVPEDVPGLAEGSEPPPDLRLD